MSMNKKPVKKDRSMAGAMMGSPVEKPKDFKGTLKKLVSYLSKY